MRGRYLKETPPKGRLSMNRNSAGGTYYSGVHLNASTGRSWVSISVRERVRKLIALWRPVQWKPLTRCRPPP